MSNKKLTEERIKELIKKVLEEDISVSINSKIGDISRELGVPTRTASKDQYKDLAGADSPSDTLDDKDFNKAFNYKSDYKGRKSLATKIYNNSSKKADFKYKPAGISPGYEAELEDVGKSQVEMEPEDLPPTAPSMYSQGAASGKFAADVISFFDALFSMTPAADTLEKRIQRISEVSRAFVGIEDVKDLSFLPAKGPQKLRGLLSSVMALDYIAAFAKYFDSGSGAYLFEAFCALVSGGKVIGKDNKSGDFSIRTTAGLIKGSSKYYRKTSTPMSQAISGFENNKPVTYMVCQKTDVGSKATSDPDQLVEIGIHLAQVTIDTMSDPPKITSSAGDLDFEIKSKKGAKGTLYDLKISVGANSASAVVQLGVLLVDDTVATYRQAVDREFQDLGRKAEKAYDKMVAFINSINLAQTLTKKFINTGDKKLATKPYRS